MPASGGGLAGRPCRPACPRAGVSRSSRACPSLRTRQPPRYREIRACSQRASSRVQPPDRRLAVVLRKLVGVELRERPRQPALYARRKRLLLFLPVERHELAEFVGALDHVLERLRHERARALAAREFAREEERRVTKLHFASCFPP